MTRFGKVTLTLIAASLVAAPVAASAEAGARATATVGHENGLEGNSSWLIGLAGLIAGIVVIALVIDDDTDAPVSP